jgi:hypothetical protein
MARTKKNELVEELAYLEEELVRRGKTPPKVDPRSKWQNSFRYMKFQRTYAKDPSAFAHDCIDWDGGAPTEYQDHALESIIAKKRIALWGPRGLGKTKLLSVLAWWGLLTVDHVKETITAGSFRQLERILWPEIRALVPKIKWDHIGRPPPQERKEIKQTDITLSDTALTITASPREAGKFEGAHAKQRVLDESKEIEDDIFDSVEGSFSHTEQPLAIAASTPGLQAGRFYDICRGGPGYLDWYRIHVSKDDMIKAGFMDPEWAENRRLQWGEDNPKYINQIEGDFANDDPSTIIPFHWVSKAKERWLDMEADGTLPTRANRVGVDCAWGGADRAVITRAHNNVILTMREYDYRDTVQLAGQVMMDIGYDKQIPIVVDIIGWGAGVYDTLKHGGYNVVAFNAGAKSEFGDLGPEDEELEFLNNRAASWYYTWTLLDPNNPDAAAIPDHEYLDAELSTPKWKPTQSGKYQVESKHDIRKRRKGRSTDYADSAIMAWIADAILMPKKSKTEVAIVTFALNRGSPSIRIR